jgi:hypothetical protein
MRRDPRTLLTAAAVAATVLVGTAACGDAGGDDARATAAPSTPTSGSVTSTPTTPGARMTEGISQPVVLVRSGGIGGVQDRVQVRPDGTVTVTSKGGATVTRQLSEAQLAAVVQAVQKADLDLLGTGAPTPSRSDELYYTITAEGRTYRTTETQAPAAVRPLLDELGSLLSAPAPTP